MSDRHRRSHRRDAERSDGFYAEALEASDRDLLDRAYDMEGVDEEVALLRLEIRRLLEDQRPDPRLLHAAVRLLIQALAARHRLSGGQSDRLSETTARLVEQFGEMLLGVEAAGAEVDRE